MEPTTKKSEKNLLEVKKQEEPSLMDLCRAYLRLVEEDKAKKQSEQEAMVSEDSNQIVTHVGESLRNIDQIVDQIQRSSEEKKPVGEEIQSAEEIDSDVGGSLKRFEQRLDQKQPITAPEVTAPEVTAQEATTVAEGEEPREHNETLKKKKKRWKRYLLKIWKFLVVNRRYGKKENTSLSCVNEWVGVDCTEMKVKHEIDREKLREAKRESYAYHVFDRMHLRRKWATKKSKRKKKKVTKLKRSNYGKKKVRIRNSQRTNPHKGVHRSKTPSSGGNLHHLGTNYVFDRRLLMKIMQGKGKTNGYAKKDTQRGSNLHQRTYARVSLSYTSDKKQLFTRKKCKFKKKQGCERTYSRCGKEHRTQCAFRQLLQLKDQREQNQRNVKYGMLKRCKYIPRKWKSGMDTGFHSLQNILAMRGLPLLKVGGKMIYSAYTINPIVDEAVTAEILRRCGDCGELVYVSEKLPELVRRPGLKPWKVADKGGWFTSYKDIPQNQRGGVPVNMFPVGKNVKYSTEITEKNEKSPGEEAVLTADVEPVEDPVEKVIEADANNEKNESKEAVKYSLFLESLKKKRYEVIYMVDASNKYVIGQLKEIEEKKLVSATKEGLKLEETEDERKVVSDSSMACYMSSKEAREINSEYSIMVELRKRVEIDKNDKSKDLFLFLLETALLISGFSHEESSTFRSRIHMILKLDLSFDEEQKENRRIQMLQPVKQLSELCVPAVLAAKKLELDTRVVIVGDNVNANACLLAENFRLCKIYYEMIGNVMMETMSTGRVVDEGRLWKEVTEQSLKLFDFLPEAVQERLLLEKEPDETLKDIEVGWWKQHTMGSSITRRGNLEAVRDLQLLPGTTDMDCTRQWQGNMENQFPQYDLEDKVSFNGAGNDKCTQGGERPNRYKPKMKGS